MISKICHQLGCDHPRMYSLIVLCAIQSCYCYNTVIREAILGANFSSNGLWPDVNISGEKYPFLHGYWNITNINLDQLSDDVRTIESDEVKWICLGNNSNLPQLILLSKIWKFESTNVYIQLQAEIGIKGPADIGNTTWNNSTIALYRTGCTRPYYWRQEHFTTANGRMKYLINSNGGSCQIFLPIAAEKERWKVSNYDRDITSKIYSTFSVLFCIVLVISVLITLLFVRRSKKSSYTSANHSLKDGDEDDPTVFTPMPTIPE